MKGSSSGKPVTVAMNIQVNEDNSGGGNTNTRSGKVGTIVTKENSISKSGSDAMKICKSESKIS